LYHHDNLQEYIRQALPPGWTVVLPPATADVGKAPSEFPEVVSESACTALAEHLQLPADAAQLSPAELADMLNGHCETVAVTLAEHVVGQIGKGGSTRSSYSPGAAAAALAAGYRELTESLQLLNASAQIRLLFDAEKRGLLQHLSSSSKCGSGNQLPSDGRGRQHSMWSSVLQCASPLFPPGLKDPERSMLAGTESASSRIAQAAAACVTNSLPAAATASSAASSSSSALLSTVSDTAVLPLYILCYIWDGDELDHADLAASPDTETAQLSLHVCGLVLCGQARTALICDPNGPLLQGGGVEFLELPVSRLPEGVMPSTSNSRFDRDAATAAAERSESERKRRSGGKGGERKQGAKKGRKAKS
jgi:hypothetical protein